MARTCYTTIMQNQPYVFAGRCVRGWTSRDTNTRSATYFCQPRHISPPHLSSPQRNKSLEGRKRRARKEKHWDITKLGYTRSARCCVPQARRTPASRIICHRMTSTDSSVSQAARTYARMYVRVHRDCRVQCSVLHLAHGNAGKRLAWLAKARSNESTRFFNHPQYLSFHLSPVIPSTRVCVTLRFRNYSLIDLLPHRDND